MNQNNNDQLIIEVKRIGPFSAPHHMKNHLDFSKGGIKSLDVLFTLGRCHADYVAWEFPYQFICLGDGSDYYYALTSAIFEDEKGFAVSNNMSISIFDHSANKRIYIIVLEKGNNIVVHDLFPRAISHGRPPEADTVLVANSKVDHKTILGMHPRWAENCTYDLAMCARMFGFTFERLTNVVDVPTERRDNWFKTCRDQLVPNDIVSKFMSRTA